LVLVACIFTRLTPSRRRTAHQSNVGPGASEDAMKQGTTTGETGTTSKGTTGASSRPSTGGDASASDAQTSAPVNNQGTATRPGAAKDGVNQR
jgi:hypothetical protein